MHKGQSLIEVLVAIAVGAIIIGGVAVTIGVTLRSNVQNKNVQTATTLAQEVVGEVSDLAAGNWHNLDALSVGAQYQIATTGPNLTVKLGAEPFIIDGKQFIRFFTYQNTSRDSRDNIESNYNAANNDPSTKKIIVQVNWQEGADTANVTLNKFVTRSKNLTFRQTNWVGGRTTPSDPSLNAPNTQFFNSNNINYGTAGSIKVQGL